MFAFTYVSNRYKINMLILVAVSRDTLDLLVNGLHLIKLLAGCLFLLQMVNCLIFFLVS